MKVQVNKMFDIDKLNIYWAGDTQDKIFGRGSDEEILDQYDYYVSAANEVGEDTMSFEDFYNSKKIESSQDRELLDYEKQIILHPRNAHHLLMPLTDEIFVKDIYDELIKKGVIEKVDSSFVGSMLPNTNVKNAIVFVKGKNGVGPVALGITNSATNQADGLNINTFYQNQEGDDVPTTLLFKGMESTYTLDNYTDNEGTIISEILSQLLTTQVDNVKNPTAVLMNINMQTLGVILYLIRRKINPKSIVLFLQQPIISEYLKYQRRNESLFNKQADAKSNNKKEYKHELSKDYLIKKLLKDLKYPNITLPEVYRVGDEVPRLSIDNAGMFENIKSKEFDQKQLDYLAYFLELQSQSRAFSDFQQSQNSDTKGLKDKQMLDEANAIRARMELSQIITSSDVARLDYEGVISPFYRYGRQRYNIFNQFYTLANSTFGHLLTNFKDKAAELEKSDGKDRVRQTIENDFLLFLIHNYVLSKDEFDRLMKDGSVAKRVLALKETIPSNLVLKAFFPVLRNTIDLTDNRKIDNLRLFEKELNALDSNDMRSSLEEIHDVDPDLYTDIVKLLMFQSGLNISPFNYRSVVPVGLNTNRTEFNDYEYLYQDLIQNAVKAMKAQRFSVEQAKAMFEEFKILFGANNVKFLRKNSWDGYPYPIKKTWNREAKEWVLVSTADDKQTQTQLGNAYHKQYFRKLINKKTTTAKAQNKVENKEVFRDDDTRVETSSIQQPAQTTSQKSTIKTLPMQPDNIEQIKAGTKTITNRTGKFDDGTYRLPDGTLVEVALIGEVGMFQNNLVLTQGNQQFIIDNLGGRIERDTNIVYINQFKYAQAEGFKDWPSFEKDNKFSDKLVTGVESRYLYSVEPVKENVQTSEYTFTPENITSLKPNEVFVFGSNTQGRHGAGAAKIAMKFGAKYGQSEGLQGQAYAVITKDLTKPKDEQMKSISLAQIGKGLQDMVLFAKANPEKTFLVTKLGSSLAGYTTEEIAGVFKKLEKFIPDNVVLPQEYDPRWQTIFELDKSESQYSPSLKLYEGFINLNQLYTGEEILPFIGESEYYRYLVPMLLKMNPKAKSMITHHMKYYASESARELNLDLDFFTSLDNTVIDGTTRGIAVSEINQAFTRPDSGIKTVVHEMIHLTLQKEYEKNGEFKQKIDKLYSYSDDRAKSDSYGFTNAKEFLAEALSNPDFMEELNNIQYENETVWSYLMTLVSDFINGLLNIELKSDSVLAQVVRQSEQVLNKNLSEISKNTKVTLSSIGSEIVENWNTYFPDYSWMNDAQKQMTAKLVEEGKITLNCKF